MNLQRYVSIISKVSTPLGSDITQIYRPKSYNVKKDHIKRYGLCGSPSWTRTNDNSVNSRVLYRLSYGGI